MTPHMTDVEKKGSFSKCCSDHLEQLQISLSFRKNISSVDLAKFAFEVSFCGVERGFLKQFNFAVHKH